MNPCPDCAAVGDPDLMRLEHFDGCPIGRALDAMSAADREWFAAHPGADRYHRPLMPGDLGIASLRCIVASGKVEVRRLDQAANVRYRRLPQFTVILDQDDPSADALRVAQMIGAPRP